MQARLIVSKTGRSAAEVGDEPEEERNAEAEDKARNDRKVKCGVFTVADDIAGKFSQAEGKFSAEVEKSANEDEEATEKKKGAAEFAERVHDQIVNQEDWPRRQEPGRGKSIAPSR
jgi:hypothetical protein